MRRSLFRAAAVAATALVALTAPTVPASATASAGTTLTQVSLDVTVRGQFVETRAVIRADVATKVDQYLVCVRDSAGNFHDFTPKLRDVTISTIGTTYTATRIVPDRQTYRYYPCVYADGAWSRVGPAKSFSTNSGQTDIHVSYDDDFSGPAGQPYDSGKWGELSACTYGKSAATGKIDCGSDETLDGHGHLRIPADPSHGSAISNKDDFQGSDHAELSAWIKMPAQPGYRAYFGTSNNRPDGVDVLPTGKIDILDTYTTWPTAYRTGTHTVNDDLSWGSPAGASCGNADLSAAFHKYTARVDEGTITFLFDDVPCGKVATKADGAGKPYGFTPDVIRTNWMILSLAVSGGQQKPPTVPAVMLVDRVEERWFSTCPPSCCPTRPGGEC